MEGNKNDFANGATEGRELKPYEKRLLEEESQLKEKIGKLYDFTQSDKFSELPDYAKQMLIIQLDAMRTYNRVISYRVANNF